MAISEPCVFTIYPVNAVFSAEYVPSSGTGFTFSNSDCTNVSNQYLQYTHDINVVVSGSLVVTYNGNTYTYPRTNQNELTIELPLIVSKLSFNSINYTIKDANALHSQAEALPSQSGQNGKVLTTNGTSASWTSLPTVDQTFNKDSSNAQSGKAVYEVQLDLEDQLDEEARVRTRGDNQLNDRINNEAIARHNEIVSAISSCYKPAGSSTFANLPTPASSNLGNVYNMSEAFTTDSRFIEGSGKSYPVGTNVVVVQVGEDSYIYCWKNGSDLVYTLTEHPSVDDNVYQDDGGHVAGVITAVGTSSITVDTMGSGSIEFTRNSSGDIVITPALYYFDVLAGFVDLSGYQLSSTAVKHTDSTAVGNSTTPVYVASDGTATALSYTIAKSVPSDAVFTDTTYSVMTGAGSSTAGTSGLTPAPSSGDNNKYLKGDGTWSALTWTYDSSTETLTIV